MNHSQEHIATPGVQKAFQDQDFTRSDLERLTDEELILLYQQDTVAAYDILVSRYKDPLLNFIYRFLGNFDDALDVLQETFIRVYLKKHRYETKAKFSTWIYTIASNLAKSELRKPHRRRRVPLIISRENEEEYELPIEDPQPLPDRITDSALKEKKIQQALEKLPDVFREAVILRDIQDLSYEEIADIIRMPLGTVKSRINRGRQQLQKLLKEFYD